MADADGAAAAAGAGAAAAAAAVAAAAAAAADVAAADGGGGGRGRDRYRPLKRRRGASRLWTKTRKLVPPEPPHTHECLVCQAKLVIGTNATGYPVITSLRRHFRMKHPQELRQLVVEEKKSSKQIKVGNLFARQAERAAQASSKERITACRKAICQFYTYCPQNISKATIRSAAFRNMISFARLVPAATLEGKLFLSDTTLARSVADDFDAFRRTMHQFANGCLARSHGNAFAQGIHDCVTLKSGQKFLAVGLSCVDPWMSNNYTIALGFVPAESGTGQAIADMIDEVCFDVTGQHYTAVAHSTMSDYAALNLSLIHI